MFSWLLKRLFAHTDLSGIFLEDTDIWEVAPPRESSHFFLALKHLLPSSSNLYLENPIDCKIEKFVASCQLPDPVKVRIGTIWPKPTWYHVAASPENLDSLAGLTKNCSNQDACIHLVAYKASRVLLSWYDAWTDPMWLSTQYEERDVASFATELGSAYSLQHVGSHAFGQ